MPSPVLISSAQSSAATFTMPAYAVGDLILVYAYNSAAVTIPSNPDGGTGVNGPRSWSRLTTVASAATGLLIAYRHAHQAGLTSGTWTGATRMGVQVWRGVDNKTPFGTVRTHTGTGSATNTFATMALTDLLGNSIVSTGLFNLTSASQTTPAGYTRDQTIGTAPIGVVDHSTAAVSTFPTMSQTASTTAEFVAASVEMLAKARWERTTLNQSVKRAALF